MARPVPAGRPHWNQPATVDLEIDDDPGPEVQTEPGLQTRLFFLIHILYRLTTSRRNSDMIARE